MKKSCLCLLLLSLALSAKGQDDDACFEPGECQRSLFLDDIDSDDPQACLDFCRSTTGCQFFTHYGGDYNYCLAFADCEETGPCPDGIECYYGEDTCDDLVCWLGGRCEGRLLDSFPSALESECLDACKAAGPDGCAWFSYHEADGVCSLLADCAKLDSGGCDSCWSGQRQCAQRKDFTKILVVGGYTDEVEVLDTSSNTNGGCSPVANYPSLPVPTAWMTSAYVDGRPRVCGGGDDANDGTNLCFEYMAESNTWQDTTPMLSARYGHASSMIGSSTWFISGGKSSNETHLDTTEIWRDGRFEEGPRLPRQMAAHCQLSLNSTHIFFAGGGLYPDYLSNEAYIFHWEEGTWTILPNMARAKSYTFCGFLSGDGTAAEEVVVGHLASESLEILDLSTLEWRDGVSGWAFRESEHQLAGDFLVINDYGLWEFDRDTYGWVEWGQTLQGAHEWFTAVAVPDDKVNC